MAKRAFVSVEEEGRALVESLGGRWGPDGGMCRCPAHADRTPSLSVRVGRRRLLLHCFAGCTASDILRALEIARLLEPAAANRAPTAVDRPFLLTAAARRIWEEGRSLPGTAGEAYLASRGLSTRSPELRFNARTPFGRAPLTRLRPAMIAAVRDDSGLVAVHRTFLDLAPGKPPEPEARRGLGRFGAGAVRLGGTASRLGLAEGIETALSATILFGLPCWATLGAERFGRVALPPEVDELVLFLDHDPGGRRAEALARRAFPQLARIETHIPPGQGDDWNDVLRALGTAPRAATSAQAPGGEEAGGR